MDPAERQFIEIGSGRIELKTWHGSPGPTIVLLHEGLGSVDLWRDFPAVLRDQTGRTVVAFSRFGHGASDPPRQARTPAFFHEEALVVLPEILSATGLDDPILLGHSDGASIALIYAAARRPERLILLAPHVFVEELTIEAIRGTRSDFDRGDLRERMARHHRDPDAAFAGWCDVWLDPEFLGWTLEEEVRGLRTPTLLIQGRDDPYGSFAQLESIEAGATGATRKIATAGGHSPHLEDQLTVLRSIDEFLAADWSPG